MTKEITQDERLDLKNLKEEWNAYYNNLLDGLKTVENKKVVMEKEVRDSILMANCDLIAENEKLKIKNNKMKRLLKDLDYWLGQELNLNYFKGEIMSFVLTKDYIMEEQKKKIEEVLKKVEE